jgi:hypothetical protein
VSLEICCYAHNICTVHSAFRSLLECDVVSVGSCFPSKRREHEPTDTVSLPRRPGSTTTQLWKLQISCSAVSPFRCSAFISCKYSKQVLSYVNEQQILCRSYKLYVLQCHDRTMAILYHNTHMFIKVLFYPQGTDNRRHFR